MKPPRVSTAVRWRDQTIVSLLETLQRERSLKDAESALMERTVRRLTPRREVWRWSEKEDRVLLLAIRKRASLCSKPFQRNDTVRQLAEQLGRTEMAVYRRMARLAKRERMNGGRWKSDWYWVAKGNCSDASGKRKG